MGRPRQFDEETAVDAATEVFWSQGFEATALPDLLRAMSLSKSSLYETFGGKDALFRRCLDHYADRLVAAMQAGLRSAPTAVGFLRDTLRAIGDDTASPDARRGCLVMNTASEFGQRQPAIAKTIARHTKRFEEVFARALRRGQEEGGVPSTLDVAASAKFLVCTLSGLKTMVKAGASRRAVNQMVDVAMRAVSA